MIELKEGTPLAMLRQFATYLEGEIHEDFGAGKLELDNSYGKGYISLYELFPGLTAWIYNVSLYEKLAINMKFSIDGSYYFGYNFSGHQLHRFPRENEYIKIGQGQDFILISEAGSSSELIIPATDNYKSCYLILNPKILGNSNLLARQALKESLLEIFANVQDARPYRYLGNIDLKVGKYAEILVENNRTDVVGRLITEGAISNMLAAHIEAHDLNENTSKFISKLTKNELATIAKVGDFIQDNISSDTSIKAISNHIGLSAKKLQAGVRFIFGCSVNDFTNSIRMEIARELLHTADLSISEICYLVGLSSRSHFSKMFQKRFGILPSDYSKTNKNDELIYELCYRSFASENLSEEEVSDIVLTARRNNSKFNITGCLIYHEGVFFQLIEGSKDTVLTLFENILQDERNYDVRTIWKGSKPERVFGHWSMALVTDRNTLKTSYDGSSKELNINHLMGDIEEQSFASHVLWRKVRKLINRKGQNVS